MRNSEHGRARGVNRPPKTRATRIVDEIHEGLIGMAEQAADKRRKKNSRGDAEARSGQTEIKKGILGKENTRG